MITTSPDGQWAAVRHGREISLRANAIGPPTARLELATEDADLLIVGPPSVLVVVTREPSADGGPARSVITLYQPPLLDPVARLELDQAMRIAAVTGPRIALVSLDGKAVAIVRVAGRAMAIQTLEPGSPVEFAVGLERNQVLFGLWRKLEAWDAVSCRPLLRMHLQLPPPPRVVGPAHGHLWAIRPGGEDLVVCRLSDGRPFSHSAGTPIDEVVCHPGSPLLILVTRRGLLRLHCFAHSLTVIDAPWRPGMALAQLVVGDDISLLGEASGVGDDELWRVPISGAGGPALALDPIGDRPVPEPIDPGHRVPPAEAQPSRQVEIALAAPRFIERPPPRIALAGEPTGTPSAAAAVEPAQGGFHRGTTWQAADDPHGGSVEPAVNAPARASIEQAATAAHHGIAGQTAAASHGTSAASGPSGSSAEATASGPSDIGAGLVSARLDSSAERIASAPRGSAGLAADEPHGSSAGRTASGPSGSSAGLASAGLDSSAEWFASAPHGSAEWTASAPHGPSAERIASWIERNSAERTASGIPGSAERIASEPYGSSAERTASARYGSTAERSASAPHDSAEPAPGARTGSTAQAEVRSDGDPSRDGGSQAARRPPGFEQRDTGRPARNAIEPGDAAGQLEPPPLGPPSRGRFVALSAPRTGERAHPRVPFGGSDRPAAIPIGAPRADTTSAPRADTTSAPRADVTRDWREPLAAFATELMRGGDAEIPVVAADTELGHLATRLGLLAGSRRALVALYGLYLVGEPALAIAPLAHALGSWIEGLGGGDLHALAMLSRRGGRIALRSAVTDLLDGVEPSAIRIVGDIAEPPRAGAMRVARDDQTDAALETVLAARLGQIAVIEGDPSRALLEAQLHNMTAVVFTAPGRRPVPWPRDASLVVVTDPQAPVWVTQLPLL
jgi:hypothetical protein